MKLTTRINPHQNIIARFPFTGVIRPLTRNERTWSRMATDAIRSNLKELPIEVMPLTKNDFYSLNKLERKARDFERDNIPAAMPDDLEADFQMAWFTPLAAKLALLTNKLGKEKPVKIMQMACNYGPLLWFIKQETGSDVFGFDVSRDAVNFSRALNNPFFVDLKHGVAQAIPFRAGMFDVVISRHFLCSNYRPAYYGKLSEREQIVVADELLRNQDIVLPHYLKLLWQIDRVLAPGGYFISAYEDMLTPKSGSLYFRKLIKMESLNGIAIAQK